MDKIIDEWIECWKSGEKVPCEKLFDGGSLSQEQQLDLICMELLIRREQGDDPTLHEFIKRFPQFQRELEAHFALEDYLSADLDTQKIRSAAAEENLEFLTEQFDPIPEHEVAMPPSGEMAGRRFGDYMLLRVLGKGGMGLVFEARQISLNRIVALKMMRGDWQNEKGRKQFKREAQAIAGLDYPHIVKILDAGEVNGSPYYTMTVMAGGSLAERLPEFTRQTRQAVEIVATIARALSHVHGRGIVHRDIKHSNILLDADKQPHLSDFGLCRDLQLDPSTTIAHGNIVGTPMFLAPEQIETGFGKISPATDVYALGVVLFHLIVGHPPFEGKSVMQVLWSSVHREPNFDEVPDPDLADILKSCLAKKSADRYEDAGHLAEQLETWLGQNTASRPLFGRMLRSWKQLKRQRGVFLGGISCLLLLIVGGLLFRSMTNRANAPGLVNSISADNPLSLANNSELYKSITTEKAESARDSQTDRSNFLNRLEQRKRLALRESFVGDTEVLAVCFSFDGAYMAWSHANGMIRVRHRPTSKDLEDIRLKGSNHVWTMAFHPEQNVLAWGASDGFVTLYDVTKQTELRRFRVFRDGIGHVEFSRNGKHLICACAKTISTWDLDQVLATTTERPEPAVNPITFSSNFQTVRQLSNNDRIVSCGDDGFVRIWDWKNSLLLLGQKISSRSLHNVVVSPDGKRLAAGGADGVVRLLDAETLQPIHEYAVKHGSWIRGLAFTPDGSRLVSTSENGDIRMWSVSESREVAYVLSHSNRALAVAFAPDGRSFATAGDDNKCLVWDFEKIQEDGFLSVGEAGIRSLCVGSKIGGVGGGDGQIRLFDPRSRTMLSSIKTDEASIQMLAISPDETVIASLGPDASLKLWQVLTQKNSGHAVSIATDPVGLTFSIDGQRLGIGSQDVVSTWGVHPFQQHRKFPVPQNSSSPVQFQPGLEHFAYVRTEADSRQLCLRNLSTGEDVQRFAGNIDDLQVIKFSTSGKKLAAIGANGDVKVWEIGILSSPMELHSTQAALSCVNFAADDEILAAGDANGCVRLYNLKTGTNSLALHVGGNITDIAFTLDGNYLIGTGESGTVKIWDARPLTEE